MNMQELQRVSDSSFHVSENQSYKSKLRKVKDSADVKPAKRLLGMLLKKKHVKDAGYKVTKEDVDATYSDLVHDAKVAHNENTHFTKQDVRKCLVEVMSKEGGDVSDVDWPMFKKFLVSNKVKDSVTFKVSDSVTTTSKVTLEKGWYVDENGNIWNANSESEESAQAKSNSLSDCHDCIACSDCTNCTNCRVCHNCTDCSDCIACTKCTNCTYCRNSHDCRECGDCTDCTNSTHCSECDDCTNCTDCRACSECDDCSGYYKNHPARKKKVAQQKS